MSKGYSMLSKELMDSEDYFSERFTRSQAYMDLCLLAAWKDRKFIKRGQVVEIKAGQLAKSEEELAARWKWSRNTVRKYLNEQQKIGNIEQQKSRLITIISIKFGLNLAQQIEQQTPSKTAQQIEQQQEDIYNNKENNIKEKDTIVSKKKEEELVSRLSELERTISSLEDENKKLKEEKEKLEKKNELDFSIVAPEYSDIVKTWLQYKKERRESYKPSGFKTLYKKLVEMSGNNPLKAKMIVEQSMSNNYSGLFPLKVESLPLGFIQKDEGQQKYIDAETW